MKHFIGGYEVSIETKIAYERERSRHEANKLMIAEAVRAAMATPCRRGWNVVCHCVGKCGKDNSPINS